MAWNPDSCLDLLHLLFVMVGQGPVYPRQALNSVCQSLLPLPPRPRLRVCTMPGFVCESQTLGSSLQPYSNDHSLPSTLVLVMNSCWGAHTTVTSPVCYDVLIFKLFVLRHGLTANLPCSQDFKLCVYP